eukprot:463598-Rhodomonas_salina.1
MSGAFGNTRGVLGPDTRAIIPGYKLNHSSDSDAPSAFGAHLRTCQAATGTIFLHCARVPGYPRWTLCLPGYPGTRVGIPTLAPGSYRVPGYK